MLLLLKYINPQHREFVVSKAPKSTLELGSMVSLFNVPEITIIAIQTIFADVSLTNDEKTVAIRLLNKDYDRFK